MNSKEVIEVMNEAELVKEWVSKLEALGYIIDEQKEAFIAGILYGSKKRK